MTERIEAMGYGPKSHYKKMVNKLIVRVCLTAFWAAMLISCRTAINFLEPDSPRYSGAFTEKAPVYKDTLTVVSFNVKFSGNINRAISELNTYEPLKNADLILLQEMDNEDTRQIAEALRYNYVYYPASIHPHHDKEFGNAILTKWPITQDAKVMMPFEDSRTKTRRIAVQATLDIGEFQVLAYSTHLATIWSGEEKRKLQEDAILQSVPQQYPYVIIGGDFNTMTGGRLENLDEKFTQHGYIRATKGIGKTVKAWPFKFQADHIFIKGFQRVDSGKIKESDASDHVPIWVTLKRE